MKYTSGYARKPAIFVSSTCYDLKQIRQDIRDFIENDLGYEAILSEFDTFPTNPSINTTDNCLRVVEERADIFVLIVGGRYGYITNHADKSITNLEYLRAKSKGVPIYVFVDQTIINLLSVWEKNPEGDFSNIVDSSKVFSFVKELRSIDSNWVHEFRNANDIISCLRLQFAYLVNDSVLLRRHIVKEGVSSKILKYSGQVFQIAIEKPELWEYRLFAAALKDNLEKLDDLRYDVKYGISFNRVISIDNPQEVILSVQTKMEELRCKIDLLNPMINIALVEAFGEPGQPGDAEYIIYVAEKIIDIYKYIHEWSLSFNSFLVPEEFRGLLHAASRLSETVIQDIESFIKDYNDGLEHLVLGLEDSTEKRTIEFKLDLRSPNIALVEEESKKIMNLYGLA